MGRRDSLIDAYIAKSAPYARPILVHLREVVHTSVGDVEETMKWGISPFHVSRGPVQHGCIQKFQSFTQARVCGMDHGGKDRCNERQASIRSYQMDRAREVQKLEIRKKENLANDGFRTRKRESQ